MMLQQTSRWSAVSSISLCTPPSCVHLLLPCEVPSSLRTGWTLLHDCSFLARGQWTWRQTALLKVTPYYVSKNPLKKKKKNHNPPATGSAAGRKKTVATGHTERVLFVAEGLCIGLAAVSHAAAVIHSSTSKPVVQAPLSVNKLPVSTWQVLPLWGVILLNVILRARQWQVTTGTRASSSGHNWGLSDFTSLINRVQQLEEDVQNTVTASRVLSRQLEKLGVRFRVTRRSLRDPIQEMAVVTQKTSEVVSALAQHQDMLESELQELQHILLAMQEQQAKQVALISAGIGKMVKGQQKFEERVAKELSAGKQRKGGGEVSGHDVAAAAFGNHPANGAPQKLSKSATEDSTQNFSKVDFWAEPAVQPVTVPLSGHKDPPSASFSKASEERPQNPTGLGTFFRSRKQFNGNQGPRFRDNHGSDKGLEGQSTQ